MLAIYYFLVVTTIVTDLKLAYSQNSKILPTIKSLLDKGHKVNVLVSFVGGTKPALEKSATLQYSSRNDKNKAIIQALEENLKLSQDNIVKKLTTENTLRVGAGYQYYKQFWLGNKLFVKQANAEVIQAIVDDPNVLQIKPEPYAQIPVVTRQNFKDAKDAKDTELIGWGVTRIQAPEAWEELGGKTGDGVLVGHIDTGVRHTHNNLKENFVGTDYGWFDPFTKSLVPVDIAGHGTHTLGSIVGKQFGVAPGARWMSCLACNETFCPPESIIDCLQWMACPTLPDGSNKDCSKAPQIINNSWSTTRGSTEFNEELHNLRALGIIPVFSIGNSYSTCGTTQAPGEFPFVIAVGATDSYDQQMFQGSAGPASDGGIKPDLVAPGVATVSASHTGDDQLGMQTGTSMAAPYVSGVVALLKVRQPDISYEQVFELITKNTDKNLTINTGFGDYYCNVTEILKDYPNITEYPNIYAGFGLVNALKAVEAQTALLTK